jgi:hypothetical protein
MKTSRRSSLNYAAIAAWGAPSDCGRFVVLLGAISSLLGV